jgi:hypothetical protein
MTAIGACSHVEKVTHKVQELNDGVNKVTTGVEDINEAFRGETPVQEEVPSEEGQPEEQPLEDPTEVLEELLKTDDVTPVKEDGVSSPSAAGPRTSQE